MSNLEVKTTKNFNFLYNNHVKGTTRISLLEGGSRCFKPLQKVVTNKGSKCIKNIKAGDLVLSYNEATGKDEYKRVLKNNHFTDNKKPIIRLILRNGKIIEGTEDHKIYFEGGWITLKHFVSLLHDRKMEKNTKF